MSGSAVPYSSRKLEAKAKSKRELSTILTSEGNDFSFFVSLRLKFYSSTKLVLGQFSLPDRHDINITEANIVRKEKGTCSRFSRFRVCLMKVGSERERSLQKEGPTHYPDS